MVVCISYQAAFLTQAAIATIGALLFALAMPETSTSAWRRIDWRRKMQGDKVAGRNTSGVIPLSEGEPG